MDIIGRYSCICSIPTLIITNIHYTLQQVYEPMYIGQNVCLAGGGGGSGAYFLVKRLGVWLSHYLWTPKIVF